MIRPSLLPIAEKCGHAVELHERHPEGSGASEAGTRWHEAMAAYVRTRAGHPGLAAIFATLPPHAKAEAEAPLGLDDPEDGGTLTAGTADLVLTHDDGSITVIDWKTGIADKVEPPDDNLQLLAYGIAAALSRGAKRFRVGLYFTTAPPARLSRWFTDGDDYWQIVARIRAVLGKPRDVPITGPHCDRCYRRSYCNAWMLPAGLGETALAPFTAPGGLTHDNAPNALHVVQAMRDALEIAEARLKTWARENGGIRADGKVWAPRMVRGRRSLPLAAVEQHPDLIAAVEARGCIREGQPYEVFSWVNESSKSTNARGAASEWLAPPKDEASSTNAPKPRRRTKAA